MRLDFAPFIDVELDQALAPIRAYLGGRLKDARPWLRAIARRIDRIEGRGALKAFPAEAR